MIRKANISDLDCIICLYKELDTDAELFQPQNYQFRIKSKDYLSNIITDHDIIFYVCEIDGDVIGFINAQKRIINEIGPLIKSNFIYINDLIISEKYRNKKYGKSLLDANSNLKCEFLV